MNYLDKPRYKSNPDFPYTYVISKEGFIYKTMRGADEQKGIFSELPTAQLHLLPRFAEACQNHLGTLQAVKDQSLTRTVMTKSATQFVEQFTMFPNDVKEDGTFIVQDQSDPDAIVPVIYDIISRMKVIVGSFKSVKIKKQNLIIFSKSEGYVIGFEGDPDGVYLLYKQAEWVMFFKGIEEMGDKLTDASYKFLETVENALAPKPAEV